MKQTLLHHIYTWIVAIWVVFIIYSFLLAPYTDTGTFQKEVFSIQDRVLNTHSVGSIRENGEKYTTLRNSFLSSKYVFQDYGITLIILGVSLFFLLKRWNNISSPRNGKIVVVLGFILPIILTWAFLINTSIEFIRWVYPPWADSPWVAYIDTPYMLIMWYIFIIPHLIFLYPWSYKQRNILKFPYKPSRNIWLYLLVTFLLLFFVISLIYGMFIDMVSYALLMYFFLSLVKDST